MDLFWEYVKNLTPLQTLAGLAVLLVAIAVGAWRDANRSPHRYRSPPPETAPQPRDRDSVTGAASRQSASLRESQ